MKPRIKVRSASAAAARVMKPESPCNNTGSGKPANIACQCESIRPGMMTLPPQWITRAPSGVAGVPLPTVFIRVPSTSRNSPSRKLLDVPSKSRKFVKRMGREVGSGAALAGAKSPNDATEAVTPATKPRRDRSAVIRCDAVWMADE
ncbi:MAG: hypothetical protein WA431_00510 [Candidatus Cybelea sp.]